MHLLKTELFHLKGHKIFCFWFFHDFFHDIGGKLPPVSTKPVANLPQVSMTLVSLIPAAICNWYQRHWRQIMGTISGC
jgi:hypothetical protein